MNPSKLAFGSVLGLLLAAGAAPKAWKFGLIGDSQWPDNQAADAASGYRNPNGVAVDIIRQIDRQFIARGVKFVIAVGDLGDFGSDAAFHTRATWSQPLFDAGIGFFPLRGNHDDPLDTTNAAQFVHSFPQTLDGFQNRTPQDAFDWTDSAHLHPAFSGSRAKPFSVGTDFSSPRPSLSGLSYAFTYENATFVLLDQFRTPDPDDDNTVASQIPWIDSVLAARNPQSHGFVLGHKGIITEYHADNLFGDSPSADSAGTNAFLRSLVARKVRWYIGGHDHIQNRSLVSATNDASVQVQDIILGTASFKSYHPQLRSLDSIHDLPAFGRTRQIQLSQDLDRIGFTIVTVDGPLVTAEYWATPPLLVGQILRTVPDLSASWSLRETFGYATNGRQFLVPQGGSYAGIEDSGFATTLRILAGKNTDESSDFSSRAFAQQVSVGWAPSPGLASASATLWGMRLALGCDRTPPFALSISYDRSKTDRDRLRSGKFGVLRRIDGTWRIAAASDSGGTGRFAMRAWAATDPPGSFGVDTLLGTAWAVVERDGEFAVGTDTTRLQKPPQERAWLQFTGRSIQLPSTWRGIETSIRIRSLDGRIATSWVSSGSNLDIPAFPAGIYWIQARASGQPPLSALAFLPL